MKSNAWRGARTDSCSPPAAAIRMFGCGSVCRCSPSRPFCTAVGVMSEPSLCVLCVCCACACACVLRVCLGTGDDEFECVSVLNGHSADVKSIRWHPTDHILLSASYDNAVRVWSDGADDPDGAGAGSEDWHGVTTLTGHSSTVWAVAWAPDGNRFGTMHAHAHSTGALLCCC
jgi:WD40 repeat protein